MEVIIDGVKYIPAKHALANEEAIARGLLMQFWGVCSDERLNELINDREISVYVNDCGRGESLRDTLDMIAEQV